MCLYSEAFVLHGVRCSLIWMADEVTREREGRSFAMERIRCLVHTSQGCKMTNMGGMQVMAAKCYRYARFRDLNSRSNNHISHTVPTSRLSSLEQ